MGFTIYVLFSGLIALPPLDSGAREALLPKAASTDICHAHFPFIVGIGSDPTKDFDELFSMCNCSDAPEPCLKAKFNNKPKAHTLSWAPLNGLDIYLIANTKAGHYFLNDSPVKSHKALPSGEPPLHAKPSNEDEVADTSWIIPLTGPALLGESPYSPSDRPYENELDQLAARFSFGGGELSTCSIHPRYDKNGNPEEKAPIFEFQHPSDPTATWRQVIAESVQWSRFLADADSLALAAFSLINGEVIYTSTIKPTDCGISNNGTTQCIKIYVSNVLKNSVPATCESSQTVAEHFNHYNALFCNSCSVTPKVPSASPEYYETLKDNQKCAAFATGTFPPEDLYSLEECKGGGMNTTNLSACPIVQ